MAAKAEAAAFKDKGNKALAAKKFDEAIAMYTEVSVNLSHSLANRNDTCTEVGHVAMSCSLMFFKLSRENQSI